MHREITKLEKMIRLHALKPQPRRNKRDAIGDVGGDRTRWRLGDYLDEINGEVAQFDSFVTTLLQNPGSDHLSNAFFTSWVSFINGNVWSEESQGQWFFDDQGNPYGWIPFYEDNRGLWDMLWSDDPVWDAAQKFELHLQKFYDEAVAGGATPPFGRPEAGHQYKPEEDPINKAWDALKWVGIIGGVVAFGYVLHGAAQFRK